MIKMIASITKIAMMIFLICVGMVGKTRPITHTINQIKSPAINR
jgi:hypothetical protein